MSGSRQEDRTEGQLIGDAMLRWMINGTREDKK